MEHHADFAIAVERLIEVTTSVDPGDGHGLIEGQIIALGWWVDPEGADDADHESVGTLYLIVDERRPRPMWIKQADLTSTRILD